MNKNLENIDKVLIIIQFDDGSAHQVLTSKENKNIAILMIAKADGGLKIDKELEPIILKTKQ